MEPVSEQAGRYQRSAAGMVGAMLVLVGVVIAFVVFRDSNRVDPPAPVHAVNYTSDLRYARQQASFDVLAPPSLPAGWRATTVEYVPGARNTWHLGILTDQNRYVGLEQSEADVRSMVETFVDPAPTRGKPVSIDGASWSSWTDAGGDRAFVRRAGGVTTLVVGHDVPEKQLLTFTASLR
jgi:hypothetical protein